MLLHNRLKLTFRGLVRKKLFITLSLPSPHTYYINGNNDEKINFSTNSFKAIYPFCERPYFDISWTCFVLREIVFMSGVSRKPCSRQKFSGLKYSLSNTGFGSLQHPSGIFENPLSSLLFPPYSTGIAYNLRLNVLRSILYTSSVRWSFRSSSFSMKTIRDWVFASTICLAICHIIESSPGGCNK